MWAGLFDRAELLRVEGESAFGNEGRAKDNCGGDSEMDAVEEGRLACHNVVNDENGLPSDGDQRVVDLAVLLGIGVEDRTKDSAQHRVENDVGRVEEGHHGAQGGYTRVLC